MKNVNMNPDAKLSFLERFAYGIGDYAGNLIYSAISAFLLVYYTNVIGASAAAAASIIAISKFLDGISDLAMGYIVDHTHSKWGKARPWIARLCIPLAVCTVLMFSVPSAFAGKAQIAYMFLTYNLVSTIFYTGINVPYATMQGLMTMNQYERGLLGNLANVIQQDVPYVSEGDGQGFVKLVRSSTAKWEPLDTGNPADKVFYNELINSDDGSAMNAGFMTIENCSFPWDVACQEIYYVVEGTLTVEKDGRVFTGHPGDCLFFQNGAHLKFGSPDKVKVFYATH